MIAYIFGPLFSIVSAVPLYFYLTGQKYSDNSTVKRIFKNFVWVYTKLEIGYNEIIGDKIKDQEQLELESVIKTDNYNFYEYKISFNNKNYYVTLINFDKEDKHHEMKLEKLRNNLETKINNKNLIVHCSLVNDQDDIILDVTEDFRKFKYYYDEHENESYMKYFFEYLQQKYDNLDLSGLSLMIYKNDEQFTELKHNIENLYTKTFFDVLN